MAVHVSLDGERFNCGRCRHHHCDEDYGRPGSRGPAPFPMLAIAGVIESRTCFLPMLTGESREWLRLYSDWKAGFLPWGGGTLEQPAAYCEAMSLIDSTVNDTQREKRK